MYCNVVDIVTLIAISLSCEVMFGKLWYGLVRRYRHANARACEGSQNIPLHRMSFLATAASPRRATFVMAVGIPPLRETAHVRLMCAVGSH